jgi:alpha-methylacyl-CoA racemase
MASGPLAGTRVVEFTGLAPAPFACMVLADLGAEVVRVPAAAPTCWSRASAPA